MSDLKTLHFYATPEHKCSYLEDHIAQTLFVDPHAVISTEAYSELSDLGFRRSGKHIYRPHCQHCQACISVRIPIPQFKLSRSQRRVLNKNSDLKVRRLKPVFTQEYYDLYAEYIEARHADGDMYPPDPEQFNSFLVEGNQKTEFLEFRDGTGRLLAIAVVDFLTHGLSAIYTFHSPGEQHRSLGSLAILKEIEMCQSLNLPFLYLGYWVSECRKMRYKTLFRPIEMLLDNQWIKIDQP
ncbi:arginyltransferase [Neptuniibacter sp. CAU 1671]|uniref:arginyltransferase n=1 Tax=Neptuniibacter sp. CAU 1671 TaxID=3032593 RepID=UPI0023D99FBD|nr:arginyltransferase [Neptuniibacter sp. CAU 1671]MDF2180477.1 arginyltransferase [Neptuniibacter sp. CAU 1671]